VLLVRAPIRTRKQTQLVKSLTRPLEGTRHNVREAGCREDSLRSSSSDEVVPQIMKATVTQRAERRGVCEIHLFGESRSAWTINLKAGTVTQGGTKDPDLYLEMDRGDFQAMMMNRLDIERAIKAGRVALRRQAPRPRPPRRHPRAPLDGVLSRKRLSNPF